MTYISILNREPRPGSALKKNPVAIKSLNEPYVQHHQRSHFKTRQYWSLVWIPWGTRSFLLLSKDIWRTGRLTLRVDSQKCVFMRTMCNFDDLERAQASTRACRFFFHSHVSENMPKKSCFCLFKGLRIRNGKSGTAEISSYSSDPC